METVVIAVFFVEGNGMLVARSSLLVARCRACWAMYREGTLWSQDKTNWDVSDERRRTAEMWDSGGLLSVSSRSRRVLGLTCSVTHGRHGWGKARNTGVARAVKYDIVE